jgi:curved DNA-binding protein
MIDYYEFLQISPHADSDTIHRVYRFLATRLHPDNPGSGDAAMFHLLKTAYDVLSHPDRRADYDATRRQEPAQPVPLSTSVDFMDSLDGELNRRLAVLAVLYYRRRSNPNEPEVPLADIELRMGFPRDYLDFTTWYLVKKGYVARADNAEFTLTAEGVDFVETQRANLPVLNKMLTNGSSSSIPEGAHADRQPSVSSSVFVLPAVMGRTVDRRERTSTQRVDAAGLCVGVLERRAKQEDRRSANRGRRASDQ